MSPRHFAPLILPRLFDPWVERKLRSVTTSWNGSSTLVVRFFAEPEKKKKKEKTGNGKRRSLISKSVTRKRWTILLSLGSLSPNLYPLFEIDKNYTSNLSWQKKKNVQNFFLRLTINIERKIVIVSKLISFPSSKICKKKIRVYLREKLIFWSISRTKKIFSSQNFYKIHLPEPSISNINHEESWWKKFLKTIYKSDRK